MDPDVSTVRLLDVLDAVPASGAAVFVDDQGRSIEWQPPRQLAKPL